MKWIKKGLIVAADRQHDWMVSHASLPVVDEARPGVLRVYFGTRDGQGRSQTSYVEVEAERPEHIVYAHDRPILPLGLAGSFDESGIMPSWIVSHRGLKYLYYIGWNVAVTVPYHLSIGLATSEDDGRTFQKVSNGPICDRSFDEPFFNTAPCVLVDGPLWRMWYVSCTGWELVDGRMEPRYHVKYAESADGITWRKPGVVCIDASDPQEAIGRPCVFASDGRYVMLFSYRNIRDYRTNHDRSYALGHAESPDGLTWTRHDELAGINRSDSGWDSEMIEYCYHARYKDRQYLFYNGNEFGRSGFGYAVLDPS